jgi:hypothetical protein
VIGKGEEVTTRGPAWIESVEKEVFLINLTSLEIITCYKVRS